MKKIGDHLGSCLRRFWGSFGVACEKNWGSFGVVLTSILGIISGRGSFRVAYRSANIVDMHTVVEQPDT